MNLEKFPTNETALQMLEMVSPIYDESYVAKWLYQVMGTEMETVSDVALSLRNEAFPETATYTLGWWASLYNIPYSEDADTEGIRKKILERRNNKRPINPARIEQKISEITGRKVVVKENTAPSTYEVIIFDGDTAVDYDSVITKIKELKQSNKHVNIVFCSQLTVRIRAEPEVPGIIYPYTLAGTKPDISTIGSLANVGVNAEIKTQSEKVIYPLAGNGKTGTKPDISITGSVEQHGFATSVNTETGLAIYKACGSHTLRRGR